MSNNSDFPLTGANFFGNWCETLFYGIYLATGTLATQALFFTGKGRGARWLRHDEIRWPLVFFAAAFFILLTISVSLGTYLNYVAFILSEGPDGALRAFRKFPNPVKTARSIPVTLVLMLGDYILVYRCWIIYGKRWLIVMPSIIIWLGVIAASIRSLQLTFSPVTLAGPDIARWGVVLWTLSTAQNIISTSLLVHRIWKYERELEAYAGGYYDFHLHKVLVVIAESGALYTTSMLISLILLALKNNGLYPMTNISMPLAGIVYNVILVRCSRSRDKQLASFDGQSTLHWHAAEGPGTVISTDGVATHTETRETNRVDISKTSETSTSPSVNLERKD